MAYHVNENMEATLEFDSQETKKRGFSGTTSLDVEHTHQYEVDINGNGWALETTHPKNPKIKHAHKITNWVVESAQSECYPDCAKLYRYNGISPHTHQTIQKKILKRQISRFAKLLPIVDINRITIEQSKDSTLNSTVEFYIKQDARDNSIREWANNPKLRNNLKIKIIQSTDFTTTEELSKDIDLDVVENDKVKTIANVTIDDIIGGTTNHLQNKVDESTLNLRFKKTFSIENEQPYHLSYFIFVYLEITEGKNQNGYVLLQNVIDKGDNVSTEIQDFRHLENIKKTPINLVFKDEEITNAQNKIHSLKSDNMEPTRIPAYFSDIFLSRDNLNRAKFAFAVDFRKIIKDSSTFGSLYENTDKTKIEELIGLSSIRSFIIKRRRVTKDKTNNKLGGLQKGQILEEKNSTIAEEIIVTEDDLTGLIEINAEASGIKEIDISANNGDGVRFFTGYDNTISNLSAGIYQYGVEITIEDKTKEYLDIFVKDLSAERRNLYEYYIHSNNHYNSITNRYTQDFIEEQNKNTKNWKQPIIKYLNILNTISNKKTSDIEKDILKMVSPQSATPQSILGIIQTIDNIISRLEIMVETNLMTQLRNNNPNEVRTYTSSGTNKTTSYEHWFTNDEFDANLESNVGYDYLSSAPSSALFGTGLKTISNIEYNNRILVEFKKYYKGEYKDGTNIDWSLISPAFCYFNSDAIGGIFNLNISADHVEYANLAANILAYNAAKQSGPPPTTNGKFKDTMVEFYSNINLTIQLHDGSDIVKPIEPISTEYLEPDVNPNELYISLMKAFSTSGSTNDSSNENPFANNDFNIDTNPTMMWQKEIIDQYANKYKKVSQALMPPSIQLKALIESKNITSDDRKTKDSWENSTTSTLSYFQFRYSMLNTIEILTGFNSSGHNTRIKDLSWKPLTRADLIKGNGAVICRMKSFELPIMGIKQPKGLKLPVYDNYFIMKY